MSRNVIRFGVALLTFMIGASLVSLWLYKSRSSVPTSSVSSKYAKLIVGTWEGRESTVTRVEGREYVSTSVMYLTFNNDGTAIIDYSPSGGKKFVVPYKFKDEKTIIDNLHPENLIINEGSDGTISFSPEGNRMRVEIDMIYEYKFRKIK
jgi:hypothetical protein